MNRTEWAEKTGLPPHLFDASREELAYNIFRASVTLQELVRECGCIGDVVGDKRVHDDAWDYIKARIEQQRKLIDALTKEWETKQ